MDLRTIIASCLIPVLFGFLAEALPPHYYSQSPAALPTNDDHDDYTDIPDRDYDNNYQNQDDLGEPMSDHETRFSDWEHAKNGVNDFNFPVNNHDESMEPLSDYDTRTGFPDREHDNNGVNDFNFPLNNNYENYDGSVETQPRKSPSKITKVFKFVKIVHRSDMQSKSNCPSGKRFDEVRKRCV
ncbi:uncharacterized protein LOC111063072 isoform X2 [Nilaparvata lugens]|uniref:uncharacterized protein LOC111063072 isoform X2 n=1 Tax=Nilaparvata lugens TaxID=108931 RepID=UPI00193E4123|nr:uncharacterized protein LOC111063072 isoform X2 [Nilaparvata lugens]